LFGYGKSIIDLNTEIPDGVLDLGVAEQSCAIIRIVIGAKPEAVRFYDSQEGTSQILSGNVAARRS